MDGLGVGARKDGRSFSGWTWVRVPTLQELSRPPTYRGYESHMLQ